MKDSLTRAIERLSNPETKNNKSVSTGTHHTIGYSGRLYIKAGDSGYTLIKRKETKNP